MKAGFRLPTSSNDVRPRAAPRGPRPDHRAAGAGAWRCRREEQARCCREELAGPGAGQNGRGVVEPALLHQRVGEKGGRVPREASRRAPDLPCGQGLTRFGLHLAEVATPAQREGAKDLHRTER